MFLLLSFLLNIFTNQLTSIYGFQSIFERFDRDHSGKIDSAELREALLSLGFAVSPVVLDLLVSKFDKSGGKNKAIEYDNFIEYVSSLPSVFSFDKFFHFRLLAIRSTLQIFTIRYFGLPSNICFCFCVSLSQIAGAVWQLK